MLTGRLSGGSLVMSRPRRRIVPLVGSSNPPIIRNVVVLPQPEGPSSEKNSPAPTSRETPSTARTSRNRFSRSSSWISGDGATEDVIAMRRLAEVAVPCWRASRATQRTGRRGRTKVPAVRTNRPEGGLARLAYGRITHYREKTWTSDTDDDSRARRPSPWVVPARASAFAGRPGPRRHAALTTGA